MRISFSFHINCSQPARQTASQPAFPFFWTLFSVWAVCTTGSQSFCSWSFCMGQPRTHIRCALNSFKVPVAFPTAVLSTRRRAGSLSSHLGCKEFWKRRCEAQKMRRKTWAAREHVSHFRSASKNPFALGHTVGSSLASATSGAKVISRSKWGLLEDSGSIQTLYSEPDP